MRQKVENGSVLALCSQVPPAYLVTMYSIQCEVKKIYVYIYTYKIQQTCERNDIII